MSIYKDCDIRGIYPTELCEEDARRIGRTMGALHPGARMRVGGDVRLSTPALKEAFIEELVESGVQVEDLGVIPTPALYFALAMGGADGGATVTASHNPPQYNGIKFMFGDLPATREEIDALRDAVAAGVSGTGKGTRAERDILPAYRDSLVRAFAGARPMNVVLDAGNGAMSLLAPEVFRRCGHRVTPLFCEYDGRFPHRDPNPADPRHLDALREKVLETGADFGAAFDGDGDRVVFVDDAGECVMNEKALVLFIRDALRAGPAPVVYDQKSSSAVPRAALAMGGTPVPERSGHAFIKRRFLQTHAAIAGEVSGHFFFGALGYDDGLYAALTMAALLGRADAPLSHLAGEIVCPPITPDLRAACPYDQQQDWLDRVEALGARLGCGISHLDGVRLEFEDGWFLMRKSVTAQQITLRAEADTPQRLREILILVADALPEAARAVIDEYLA